MYVCYVCGYDKLKSKPYSEQPDDVIAELKSPAWPKNWGEPSGETCDCCGFKYGIDENGKPIAKNIYATYLKNWLKTGAKWKGEIKEPVDWYLIPQLKAQRLDIPESLYFSNDPDLDLYKCMICGYPGLSQLQFAKMPKSIRPFTINPPYEDHWGKGSYEACLCCQYEAGSDDWYQDGGPLNFPTEYLVEWFLEGQQWLVKDAKPQNWDLIKQLKNAGIEIPPEIATSRMLR